MVGGEGGADVGANASLVELLLLFDVGLPYEFSFCCMHVGFVS